MAEGFITFYVPVEKAIAEKAFRETTVVNGVMASYHLNRANARALHAETPQSILEVVCTVERKGALVYQSGDSSQIGLLRGSISPTEVKAVYSPNVIVRDISKRLL